jgi:alpha-amylase
MDGVRLILALHNHQPVGNFDDVFEAAYRDAYLPFLEVMEDYREIPFVLHTSGPLMEWLVGRHSEYVGRVRALVDAGRVEILGGGFHEPILTMIPHRDRVGQIRSYAEYLKDLFGQPIRGMWVPERVWEQQLVSSLAESGVEYTVLDDFHFHRAGLTDQSLFGYYLTEDDGHLVKVFPGSERLRYLIPFHEPHETYEYLRKVAAEHPGATVVFADDGEKFGSWPQTFDHVYRHGWLRRFCDMILGNRDWLQTITFSRAVETTLPLGKTYLPDSSYREMTEWVLSADQFRSFEGAVKLLDSDPNAESIRPFVRAGGFWRNFKAKYAESDEMYARMLGLSRRLADSGRDADPDYLEIATQELYRGQCNCPYWHGSFGGLYLPHLRNAIYRHLIAAHNALDDAHGLTDSRVCIEVSDFNLDARQEVRLENDRLIVFARPAIGGHVYELDVRHALANVLATLDRRPEPYHTTIAERDAELASGASGSTTDHDRVAFKQDGLARLLVYDRHPRKALIDHFYPLDVKLYDLMASADVERGDFVSGTYLSKVHRGGSRVSLMMERPGQANGHAIRIQKTLTLEAGSPTLEVHYVLEDLPMDSALHFAVEFNLAAMAGHAHDRYYTDTGGTKLGMLDSRLELATSEGLNLTDEWLDLAISLRWSQSGGVWCFPIETVSQSEGGFEGVYQSSAVIPHWVVTGDVNRRWELKLSWTLTNAEAARQLSRERELFAAASTD